jgi:hypothetical protein
MRTFIRVVPILALLAAPAPALLAQTAVDPAGHWEGTIQAPNMGIDVAIDLAKNSKGEMAGTFSQPGQGVKGLPLSTVAVEGRSVRLVVKGGEAPATFAATLSADGKSLAGEVAQGGYHMPFTLARTGDAQIAAAPKNAAIGKELEGSWDGTIDAAGRQMRVVVTMKNQSDGTAAGTVVSPDGSGVEIPIGITQNATAVTIEVASVGASFAGVLNADRTELTGTWTQAGGSVPLTLHRSAAR